MDTMVMAAFPRHTTATSTKTWDGPANETRVKTGEADSYYRRVYAWADPDAEKGTKAAYRFIHHEVTGDGGPGAASTRACISGIAVLNGGRGGTTIPDADRQGVYGHLAKHLRDADIEPPDLKATADAAELTGVVLWVDMGGQGYTVDADGEWALDDRDLTPAARTGGTGEATTVSNAVHVEDEPLADTGAEQATMESPMLIPWSGVICVEGRPTGDGRMFMAGSLEWPVEHMPYDLFAMLKDPDGGQGHAGAEVCGRIDEIWRTDGDEPGVNFIRARGVYDTALPAGAEVVRLQRQNMLRGVSVDVDSIEVDMTDINEDEISILDLLFGGGVDKFARGRIRRATVCSIPAFIEATISPDDALVAGGVPTEVSVFTEWADGDPETVVASVGAGQWTSDMVEHPPAALFARKTYDTYTPCTVDADGVVSGHVMRWGECHIGFRDRCVLVQGSDNGYRFARTGHVLTKEGDLVPTARIFAQFNPGQRGHADERLAARDAVRWYETMTQVMADVAVYDDELGMQVQGRVRPGVDKLHLIGFRASDLSPDWRGINGRREMVAIAAVNVSGYPSSYDRMPALVAGAGELGVDVDWLGLVASAANRTRGTAWAVDGEIVTLVASAGRAQEGMAGIVNGLAGRLQAVERQLAVLVEDRLSAMMAEAVDGLALDDLAAELQAEADAALDGIVLELEGTDTGRRRCDGCGALMSPDAKGSTCGDCSASASATEELAKPKKGVNPFPPKGGKKGKPDPEDDEEDDPEDGDKPKGKKKKGRPFAEDEAAADTDEHTTCTCQAS